MNFFGNNALGKLLARRLSSPTSEDEERWTETAIRSLVKKLSYGGGATVPQLEFALDSRDRRSACVVINRSTDLRESDPCETLPHAVYCRIWRWPDLNDYLHLVSTDTCAYGYQPDKETVCVNPYHYERMEDYPSNESLDCMGQAFSPIQQNWYLEAEMISYVEPENWTSISYYELEAKVGEIYQALRPSITIDGFTDPSNAERFCVGLLTNVARNTSVNTVRRVIGNGLRLEYIGGDVFAECLSEKPMYISSISFNIGRGVEPNAVYKIPQGCRAKIFCNQQFVAILTEAVADGFEAVYQLMQMCTIRASFAKGWGDGFNRVSIQATPCWVEMVLNCPLRWLDKVLVQMGSPTSACTSTS